MVPAGADFRDWSWVKQIPGAPASPPELVAACGGNRIESRVRQELAIEREAIALENYLPELRRRVAKPFLRGSAEAVENIERQVDHDAIVDRKTRGAGKIGRGDRTAANIDAGPIFDIGSRPVAGKIAALAFGHHNLRRRDAAASVWPAS